MTDVATKPATLTPKEVLRQLLDRNVAAVGASLPSGFSQERFVRLLLTAANQNPDLFDCDPRSFLAAGVTAAQLGLEPNDPRGLAYLIPFRVKGRMMVQFIIGYRGMMELARRSGQVTSFHAFPVYRQDMFTYRLGIDPTLDHVPGDHDEDPDDLTHVYAVAKVGGDPQIQVMTRRQIDRVKEQFARSKESPWNTYFVEMALKTVIRRLCKRLPQTVELEHANRVDEQPQMAIADLALPAGYTIPDEDDTADAIEATVTEPEQPATEAEPT